MRIPSSWESYDVEPAGRETRSMAGPGREMFTAFSSNYQQTHEECLFVQRVLLQSSYLLKR